jgi:hypothetical protein
MPQDLAHQTLAVVVRLAVAPTFLRHGGLRQATLVEQTKQMEEMMYLSCWKSFHDW